ncbi:MAG: hypothetical protein HY815_03845 [Candidatus Riflebacteria bacterium]|nr:hypothetical protein [Candidatus Riflebacteria bacterium]
MDLTSPARTPGALALIAIALVAAAELRAEVVVRREPWSLSIAPYVWLPVLSGTLKYDVPGAGSGGPEAELKPTSSAAKLGLPTMVLLEARSGPWSVATDFVHLKASSVKSLVKSVTFDDVAHDPISAALDAGTETSIAGTLWSLTTGYTVLEDWWVHGDLTAGIRYVGLAASLDWRLSATVSAGPGGTSVFPVSGRISEYAEFWTGTVGVTGQLDPGFGPWTVPYCLDVGAGSSCTSWQAFAGLAYRAWWGDAVVGYRHLSIDQDESELVDTVTFSGPLLAGTLYF